jgi:hypothetical protein
MFCQQSAFDWLCYNAYSELSLHTFGALTTTAPYDIRSVYLLRGIYITFRSVSF